MVEYGEHRVVATHSDHDKPGWDWQPPTIEHEGEEMKKEWCKHLRWIEDASPIKGLEKGWYIKFPETDRGFLVTEKDWWNFCPICATPRPSA